MASSYLPLASMQTRRAFGDSPSLQPFLKGPTSLLIVRNAFPELLLPRVEQSQAEECRSDNDSKSTLDVFGASLMIVSAGPCPDGRRDAAWMADAPNKEARLIFRGRSPTALRAWRPNAFEQATPPPTASVLGFSDLSGHVPNTFGQGALLTRQRSTA